MDRALHNGWVMTIILNEENVADYVVKRVLPQLWPGCRLMHVVEVTDETYVNWIFVAEVEHEKARTSVYLRQSRDRVKSKPDMAMDPERIAFEVRILELLGRLIPNVTPHVLYFDRDNNVAVLSDIKRGSPLLVRELIAGRAHPGTGPFFGDILGRVHGKTRRSPAKSRARTASLSLNCEARPT